MVLFLLLFFHSLFDSWTDGGVFGSKVKGKSGDDRWWKGMTVVVVHGGVRVMTDSDCHCFFVYFLIYWDCT